MKELLIKTNNPELLDRTLKSLGGLVDQDFNGKPIARNGICIVRSISGNIDFLKFAIKNQGYGEIVGEREL